MGERLLWVVSGRYNRSAIGQAQTYRANDNTSSGHHYVKHYLYCSAGNSEGLDEYIAFFEIAEDGYCACYIEIPSVGHALRYTEDEPADEFGALPEGPWDALEAAKPKYGTLNEISQQLFDSAWDGIRAGRQSA